MRRFLVVLAAVLILAACGDGEDPFAPTKPSKAPHEAAPWSGGKLATPLSFHVVKKETPGACASGGKLLVEDTAVGSCLQLGPAEFEVTSLVGLRKKYENVTWQLDITLTKEDAAKFGELTSTVAAKGPPDNRVAMVIGGRHLVSAPSVMEAITEGDLSITGDFTKDEIDALIKRLRG